MEKSSEEMHIAQLGQKSCARIIINHADREN